MSIIYILIPVAIVFTALGIYLFFWAVKTEQFEDLEKQGMSILFDEERKNEEPPLLSKKEIKEKNKVTTKQSNK